MSGLPLPLFAANISTLQLGYELQWPVGREEPVELPDLCRARSGGSGIRSRCPLDAWGGGFCTCPSGRRPWGRLGPDYITAAFGTPPCNPPRGAGESGWGEKCLSLPAEADPPPKKNKQKKPQKNNELWKDKEHNILNFICMTLCSPSTGIKASNIIVKDRELFYFFSFLRYNLK